MPPSHSGNLNRSWASYTTSPIWRLEVSDMRGLLFKEVASLVGSVSQWGLGWRRKRGSGVKGKAAQVAIYAVGLQAPWSNMSSVDTSVVVPFCPAVTMSKLYYHMKFKKTCTSSFGPHALRGTQPKDAISSLSPPIWNWQSQQTFPAQQDAKLGTLE